MAATTSPIIRELPIIRARGEGEQRATFFELIFDLVHPDEPGRWRCARLGAAVAHRWAQPRSPS